VLEASFPFAPRARKAYQSWKRHNNKTKTIYRVNRRIFNKAIQVAERVLFVLFLLLLVKITCVFVKESLIS